MGNIQRLHCMISGMVQGIGYRYFVLHEARKFGLKGWVRNLDSGGVELDAEGDADALDSFAEVIRNSHPQARIDSFAKEKLSSLKNYKNFEIRF